MIRFSGLIGTITAKLMLGEDLNWNGERLSKVPAAPEEVISKMKVEPNGYDLDSYLWINHLYQKPESETAVHHYFFETGDCFVFQFSVNSTEQTNLFPYELDNCFEDDGDFDCVVSGSN